ncbi:zinc finger protein Helios [Lampris incognitus]|uniref:zinc finger protein Helios n=1 Tax=Lampris incognitus TaxID=2546036 RepID=UPI0024B4C155|nr:zinc finger protein Helios [Lampris incognitus]XP_056145887.1 zinc finger protein Helios [Lampris incognitus]
METEGPDHHPASNGQCSPRKENSRMLVDLSTSAPNGQTTPQALKSLSEPTIKEEEEAGEEAERREKAAEEMGRSWEEGSGLEETMIENSNNPQDGTSGPDGTADEGARLPNGDRPFQCSQCGVSFTQKGNLLRHIKLHTGEKPFKCPFCSYACRRRDALTGHLRTHAVGKPHKCSFCGRSYKQRTSLEEHKERCHSYLQSLGMNPSANTGLYPGEVSNEPRTMTEPKTMAALDRPPVIERLHSNLGKRKSTTPQKFVGEKMIHYSYPELGYEMSLKYDKEAELMQVHMMDQAMTNAISYPGSDSLRPMVHHPGPPLSMAEVVATVNPLFHPVVPLVHRMEQLGSRDAAAPQPPLAQPTPDFPGCLTSNGPTVSINHGKQQQPAAGQEESPSNSRPDSVDSARSSPPQKLGYRCNSGLSRPRSRASPVLTYINERAAAPPGSGARMTAEMIRGAVERPASKDRVRVFGRDGREMQAFQCEHCQVLFLDHVMYTIHMGCHGYRDPLECNICGHRCKDRYEFSSHIVRGEHIFQ